MERCLSLVLDKEARISLTLEKMEAKALDEYISKNFTSSEDVRKKYSKQIEAYLAGHQNFIKEVEESNGKRYAGSIVITELQDDLTVKRIKVLYKKDIRIFKEISKNKKFILVVENRDYINYVNSIKNREDYYRIFLDYYAKELRFRSENPKHFKRIMGSWREAIKESKLYYDIIRRVLKEYEQRYKELKLDSPTVVYSKYLEERSIARKNKELEEEITSLDNLQKGDSLERSLLMHEDDYRKEEEGNFVGDFEASTLFKESEQPTRYKTYADEEGYPGDLDDSYTPGHYSNMDELMDEEEVVTTQKTKTLHNDHYE